MECRWRGPCDTPIPQTPQTQHLKDWDADFPAVVAQAQALPGFEATVEPAQFATTGFAHGAVLGMADKVSGGRLSTYVGGWVDR